MSACVKTQFVNILPMLCGEDFSLNHVILPSRECPLFGQLDSEQLCCCRENRDGQDCGHVHSGDSG